METKAHNKQMFDKVRKLKLPTGEYTITGSGPMGAHNLRKINDIDLICTDNLWEKLSEKFPIIEGGVKKISLAEDIDVLYEGSFYREYESDDPTADEQIKNADIIDGLPFVKLETILYFKKKHTRDKDVQDIELIEKFLKENPNGL